MLGYAGPPLSDEFRAHGQLPLSLTDADAARVKAHLSAGLVHALVWAFPGDGWARGAASHLTLTELCTHVPTLTRPPAVTVVVTPFGAKRAAQRLHKARML